MIARAFEDVREQDLQDLIASARPEGRQLDYKASLPVASDPDKKEFMADVCSFANSSGGDILYGIDEQRENGRATGLPGAITGVGSVNVDAEVLRLESMARDGLAPRVTGVRVRGIQTGAGPVVLVRVPRSWNAPHMVT